MKKVRLPPDWGECPEWWKNFISAQDITWTNDAINENLANFGATYEEDTGDPFCWATVTFATEEDYTSCLLIYSLIGDRSA